MTSNPMCCDRAKALALVSRINPRIKYVGHKLVGMIGAVLLLLPIGGRTRAKAAKPDTSAERSAETIRRDHRSKPLTPAPDVRDHRKKRPEIRDHRTPKTGDLGGGVDTRGTHPILPVPKEQRVTSRIVAAQSRDKLYVLDAARSGVIYALDRDVDLKQVQIRTPAGVVSVAQILRRVGRTGSMPMRVGTTSDMRAFLRARPRLGTGRGLSYTCENQICACTGDADCDDMFTSSTCGPIAVCFPDGCVCLKF